MLASDQYGAMMTNTFKNIQVFAWDEFSGSHSGPPRKYHHRYGYCLRD